MDPDNEARRDPRSVFSRQSFTEHDFEGHRALSVYIGFHVPNVRRKSHHKHHHHHHNRKTKEAKNVDYGLDIYKPAGTPPFERVRFILGGDDDQFHEPHPVFSEMEELHYEGKEMEWRETARWVKFEEDVEEGGNRWSKPHIATVSLHSLLVLRNCILNGTVLLDVNAANLEEIVDLVTSSMVSAGQLTNEQQHSVKEVLLCRHRHLHEFRNEWVDKGSRLHLIKSFAEMGKVPTGHGSYNFPAVDHPATGDKKPLIQLVSFTTGGSTFYNREENDVEDVPPNENVILLSEHHMSPTQTEPITDALSSENFRRESKPSLSSVPIMDKHQLNQGFMRKIPPNAHASNILVGEVDFLERPASAFVRLNQPYHLGDLTEVPLPSKFLFIILGPHNGGYHEVGRALASVMSDEVFHDVAYKAKTCEDLLSGIDEFMDAAIVLPAGEWDPAIRIEPPTHIIPQESRLNPDFKDNNNFGSTKDVCDVWKECGLKRTGRLFGGLFNDIRRKAPWYCSDFKDFVALQSIASVIFLYIACLVPVITFGGLLGDATKQRMAVMENLFSAVICGVIYGLFSGQPLTLLGTTGALLVFEGTIFNYCEWWNIDFLPFRLWIGLWTAAILFLFVAFDACVLVCYITRFTEEIFATLISIIFIYKAFENVINIQTKFPMQTRFNPDHVSVCHCDYRMYMGGVKYNVTAWTKEECEKYGSRAVPENCNYWQPYFVPNVYLLSLILFGGTFFLTVMLRKLKASAFFPKKIRTVISDFAVIISIGSMTLFDFYIGLNTPKLDVPQKFKPTWSERDWLIPFFGSNSWWTAVGAIIPALVATVLIFMDQEITAIIINRKENKLKKGCGYHLDLFVLAVLVAICSLFGLPWNVAATMLSMTHVASLKKVSQCSAPGEKPQVLGVREQRGTHICIFLLVGLSMFFTPLLKHIPMPVLYGIFLYMGVTSLKGLQFLNRVLILLMPQKYQPDYLFLRHVPVRIVHLFTAIQILALIILFVIKYFPESALCFPAVLILVILMRRRILVHLFSKAHLKLLDDDVPEFSKRANDEEDAFKDMYPPHATASTICGVETAKSEFRSTSYDNGEANRCSINLTELILQSGLWKCIEQQSQTTPLLKDKQSQSSFKKKRKDSKKLSSTIQEENENNKNEPNVVECLVHVGDSAEYKGTNGTAV